MHRRFPEGCAGLSAPGLPKHGLQGGLTLIELLVAISMLSLVAVLGWRGLDSIVRARAALAGDMEQTRGMQLAFAQLQSDTTHLAGTLNIANRMPIATGPGRLTLVRNVFADAQPSRLQVVTYRVQNGVLTRRESIATRDLKELDSLLLAAANDADTNPAVELQSDVAAMTMRLWDNTGWRAADAYAPPSNVAAGQPAPPGLEITLQLRGHGAGIQKIFLLGAV